jgi:hypothetical protein
MASFPQASPPTPCAHLYPPPYAPHALPISFVSILPPTQYWVRSTGFAHRFRYFVYPKSDIKHGSQWRLGSTTLFLWVAVYPLIIWSAIRQNLPHMYIVSEHKIYSSVNVVHSIHNTLNYWKYKTVQLQCILLQDGANQAAATESIIDAPGSGFRRRG